MLAGGSGVLKAVVLDDADKAFVNAAANDGLVPGLVPRGAELGSRDSGDCTAPAVADTGRTTPGRDSLCCSTICNCCGVTLPACIACMHSNDTDEHNLLNTICWLTEVKSCAQLQKWQYFHAFNCFNDPQKYMIFFWS